MHVRYNSLYISSPSSAKQREKTKVLGILENVSDGGLFFVFSFGIERWHFILSLSKF